MASLPAPLGAEAPPGLEGSQLPGFFPRSGAALPGIGRRQGAAAPYCKGGVTDDPAYLFSPGASTAAPDISESSSSRRSPFSTARAFEGGEAGGWSPRSPWILLLPADGGQPRHAPPEDRSPDPRGECRWPGAAGGGGCGPLKVSSADGDLVVEGALHFMLLDEPSALPDGPRQVTAPGASRAAQDPIKVKSADLPTEGVSCGVPARLDEPPAVAPMEGRHPGDAAGRASLDPVKVTTCPEGIREAILHQCAFMRIQGSHYEDRVFGKKRTFEGCCGRFLFSVTGLPRATRNKWCIPLCRAVAQLLRLRGLSADVVSGKLFVTDRAGAKVRVDFKPAR